MAKHDPSILEHDGSRQQAQDPTTFQTNMSTGNNSEQPDLPESSSSATESPPLAIKNKRRQAIYGAEALGIEVKPSFPIPRADVPAFHSDGTHHNAEQNNNRTDAPPPAKIQKLVKDADSDSVHLESLDSNKTATHDLTPCEEVMGTNNLHGTSHTSQEKPPTQTSRMLSGQDQSGIDLDRDEHGNLHPGYCQPSIARGTTLSHPHSESFGPHVQMTIRNANQGLKRKHEHIADDNILPPPAFVWRGSTDPNFTVFQGFLLYPELCFVLASHLPLRDLIHLYSVSRDYHIIINKRFTTTCLAIANNKAPQSARIFHFRMYAHLCRRDPANRIPHPNPSQASIGKPRQIPSFRWVAFVLFREKVVHEIMAIFAENGVTLPAQCELALKRMWLLMDLPDNPRRIGIIHNPNIFPDEDLYFMFCFIVKLDMLCHDPLAAQKHDGLRKLLLSQRDGLLSILMVLKRQKWKRQADLLVAWIRHSYEIREVHDNRDFDIASFGVESVFGVPIREAGLGKYEYWGSRGAIRRILPSTGQVQRYGYLLRPDQLVMREAVRRGLRFSKIVLEALLACYVDDETLESFPPKPCPRRIPEWNNEEYELDDVVGGISALTVDRGGDPLLDLGSTTSVTTTNRANDTTSASMIMQAKQVREAQDIFLNKCVEFCRTEFLKVDKDDPIIQEELNVLPSSQ